MDGGGKALTLETDTLKLCVDCGNLGKLNDDITYRGNEYICWGCRKIWLENREQSAFELWQRIFSFTSNPFVNDDKKTETPFCYFCLQYRPNHFSGCIWVKAQELVKNNASN